LLHNPKSSQALGYSAVVNSLAGRFDTALDHARQSIRLSPFDPVRYVPETLCTALFCTGRYQEATEAIERAIQYNPRFVPGYALRAACFVRLNKREEAGVEANRVLAMEPHFHCKVSLLQVAASTPKVAGPILTALKEAGLPE
jgi:tetratricopeptide (TPR) repeat protein